MVPRHLPSVADGQVELSVGTRIKATSGEGVVCGNVLQAKLGDTKFDE